MAVEWFYRVGSQEVGPVSGAALRELVIASALLPESLVRKGSDGEWVAAQRVKGLPFPERSAIGGASPVSSAANAIEPMPNAFSPTAKVELATAREIAKEIAAATKPGPTTEPGRRGLVLGISGAVAVVVVAVCAVAFWPSTPAPPIEQDNSALVHELGQLKHELAKVKQQQQEANDRTDAIRENESAAARQATNDPPSAELQNASLPPHASPSEPPPQPSAPSESATPIPASAPEVVAAVRKALVFLETTAASGESIGSGSGFVADEAGLIVTNHHVVEGAAKVVITFSDGRKAQVSEWVAASVGTDLVVLRVSDHSTQLAPIALAEALPQPGADVLAIGAPLGQRETVTKGIVSAIRKGSELPGNDGIDANSIWIQTSTPIAPGSSGGPLVDLAGKLVGVNTASWQLSADKGNVPFNYAVSINEVHKLLAAASRKGQPLASLPKSRTVRPARPAPEESRAVAEAHAAALAAREKRRFDALQRIYEQRLVIFNSWESAKARALQIETQVKSLQVTYARADAAMTAARRSAQAIRRDISRLENDLLYTRDPAVAERIRLRIQLLETEYRTQESRFKQAEAERNEAFEAGRGLQAKLKGETAEIERLWREGDQLELEWLTLMDPWGLLTRGEHERVVEIASQWIVLRESNPLPYLVRADAYANLGKRSQAVADLNKAVMLSPNSAVPLAYRGWAFCNAGDYRRALADYGKALQIERANATVYLFKAQTLAKKRDFGMADKDFEVAMNLAPTDVAVLRAYAFFLATCSNDGYRKGKKAVDFATKACELTNWEDWSCLDTLAAACAESRDFPAAQKWASEALSKAPEQAKPSLRERLTLYQAKKPFRVP